MSIQWSNRYKQKWSDGERPPPAAAAAGATQRSAIFDAVDEYITIPNSASFNFTISDTFSMAVWIRTDLSASGDGALIAKYHSALTRGWMITYDLATDDITWHITENATEGGKIETTSATGINDGNWHQVVCTYDGGELASGMSIYIDGSAVATTTVTDNFAGDDDINVGTPVIIGGSTSGASNLLQGKLAWAGVWNVELASAGVSTLYGSGTPIDPTSNSGSYTQSAGLVAWYELNSSDDLTTANGVIDQEGTNDGTGTNMEAADLDTDYPP